MKEKIFYQMEINWEFSTPKTYTFSDLMSAKEAAQVVKDQGVTHVGDRILKVEIIEEMIPNNKLLVPPDRLPRKMTRHYKRYTKSDDTYIGNVYRKHGKKGIVPPRILKDMAIVLNRKESSIRQRIKNRYKHGRIQK